MLAKSFHILSFTILFSIMAFSQETKKLTMVSSGTQLSIPDTGSGQSRRVQVRFSGLPQGSKITRVTLACRIYHEQWADLSAAFSTESSGTKNPRKVVFKQGTLNYRDKWETAGAHAFTEFDGLDPNQTFYFVVWDNDANGKSGYLGETAIEVEYELDIPASPSRPSLEAIDYNHIETDWNSVSGATLYRLYRSTSSNSGFQQIYFSDRSAYTDQGTHLEGGTRYYYKVKACANDDESTCSSYSSSNSIVTPQQVTVPQSPSRPSLEVVAYNHIETSWNTVANATLYRLERSKFPNSGYSQIYFAENSKYTDSGDHLTEDTEYYYRVRACANDDMSTCSAYSSSGNVTTPKEADLIVTAPNATSEIIRGQPFEIKWSYNGNDPVKIEYFKTSTFITITNSAPNTGSYTWPEVPASLSRDSQYFIRVSSTANPSIRDDSDYWSPITGCVAPIFEDPVLIATTGVRLQWNRLSVAQNGYLYQYKKTTEENWSTAIPVPQVSINNLVTVELSQLESGTAYAYRVASVCSTGTSEYREAGFTTRTECGPPNTNIRAYSIQQTSASIGWDGIQGTSKHTVQLKKAEQSWGEAIIRSASNGVSQVHFSDLTTSSSYLYRIEADCKPGIYSEVKEFETLSEDTNTNPTIATIASLPLVVAVNTNTSILIKSGIDPDGDQVKFEAASQDSNYPDGAQFKSPLYSATGGQESVIFKWNSTGTKTIFATTFDEKGNASAVVQRTISVQNNVQDSPPTGKITFPTPNDGVSGKFSVQAEVADPDGIIFIQFRLNGVELTPFLNDPNGTQVSIFNIDQVINPLETGISEGPMTISLWVADKRTGNPKQVHEIIVNLTHGADECIRSCPEFTDLTADHWAYCAAQFLCKEGLLDGDSNTNTVRPDEPINRAELAKLAYSSLGLNQDNDVSRLFPTPFLDLQSDIWYADYAKAMAYLQYQDGVSPFNFDKMMFFPSEEVTRAHVLKVLLESWNIPPNTSGNLPFQDVDNSHDAYGYIQAAFDLNIIEGDANQNVTFRPNEPATRAEVFQMLFRLMNNQTKPTIQSQDFFFPGNYTPLSLNQNFGLEHGNFNHYTKSSFNIAATGMPLNFEHTYSSYSQELPKDYLRMTPLGNGWSHNFNIYLMKIKGYQSQNYTIADRIVAAWPGSQFHTYKKVNNNYEAETIGVYDDLAVNSMDLITIKSKNQIEYRFERFDKSQTELFLLSSISDRNGNTIQLKYEQSDNYQSGHYRLTSVTGTSSRQLKFSYYSGSDLIKQVEDPIGRTVSFDFSSNKHSDADLISFKDAKDQETKYSYYGDLAKKHLLKQIELPEGNVITNEYDLNRKLTSTKNSGIQESISITPPKAYNANSSSEYYSSSITDEEGRLISSSFNRNGNLVKSISPAGTTEIKYEGPVPGVPSQVTSSNGITAYYTYDDKANPIQISLPLGITHTFTYNNQNDVLSYTNPEGKKTTYSYTQGNLASIKTPRGTTSFDLDSKGLIQKITNPRGFSSDFNYDQYGNLKESINALGDKQTVSYDLVSRLQSTKNENSQESIFQYDPNNNLSKTQRLSSEGDISTSYTYDQNDNLKSIVNANGKATSFTYDNRDLLKQTEFGGFATSYTYYPDGRTKTQTDPKGNEFNYTYDEKGRITSDGYSAFTYNADNTVKTVSGNGTDISYEYDVLNRITAISYQNNTVRYAYDRVGNLKTLTYPDGKRVEYTYYDDNLLKSVKDWLNQTTSYDYYEDGSLKRINYPNGISTDYEADALSRVTKISTEKSGDETLIDEQFTLDALGNHLTVSSECVCTENAYTFQPGTIDYTYDDVNRIKTAAETSYNHDNNGNITNAGNTDYTFDNQNMLLAVSGQTNTSYTYDPLGNRVSATRNGKLTQYALDILGTSRVLMEQDASGNTLQYYVYGLGLISRIDKDGETRYYHSDYRGSTLLMTDENAQITHQYAYDEFGTLLKVQEENFNPFRYVGQYGVMFESADLYFMRARYYTPSTGRFISEDPIWNANLFSYADNSPLTQFDPLGTMPEYISEVSLYDEHGVSTFKGNIELSPTSFKHSFTVAEIESFDFNNQNLILDGGVYAMKESVHAGYDNFTLSAGAEWDIVGSEIRLDFSKYIGVEFYGQAAAGVGISGGIGKDSRVRLGNLALGVRFIQREDTWMWRVGDYLGKSFYDIRH